MRTVTELFYSPANAFSFPASIIHRKSSFNQKVACWPERLRARHVNYMTSVFNVIKLLQPEASISMVGYTFKRCFFDSGNFPFLSELTEPWVLLSKVLSLRSSFHCFYGQSTPFWWTYITLDIIIVLLIKMEFFRCSDFMSSLFIDWKA